ncbi:MAG: VanW family protein [Firmicutes bacterium]|nr:VanW family protein [Bacillota bacterium]MCL5063918.1 VanW family protein [Bacillota bacterium]
MKLWLTSLCLALISSATPASVWAKSVPVATDVAVRPSPWIITNPTHPGSQAKALQLSFRLAEQTTNYYHASPSQALNIELAARRLNGTVIPAGGTFNYFRVVGPYTAANGYGWGRAFVGDRIVPSVGGGVCQGASTLYAAVLRTGLPVLERHHHGLTVPYLPPGEDATVAEDYLNFRFRNDQRTPILITAQAQDRHLRIALWGSTPPPTIVVHHQVLQRYPFRTVVHYDPQLAPGQTKILSPGQDGVLVKTWLTIKTGDGSEMKPLGTDRYRPSPRIIVHSPTR